jgi:hypothetical protein
MRYKTLVHSEPFSRFHGWRHPVNFSSALNEQVIQLEVRLTTGMLITITQIFGELEVQPFARNRAIEFIEELLGSEIELALYVPAEIMPQIVSPNPITPVPAHILLGGGTNETLVMKMHQRGFLVPKPKPKKKKKVKKRKPRR